MSESEVFEGYTLGDAVDAPAPLRGYLSEKNGVPGVLYLSSASDPALFLARLPRCRELDLSGVVRIVDGGVTGDGQCWVVTERPGGNIAAPAPGREGLLQVLNTALELVCLLEVVHERGRVHGDLGSDCLHLDEMEIVQISRLGFLELFSFGQEHLAAAPRYRAPEVRRGDAVSPSADLYSLGAMLGEVAQGCGAEVPAELSALVAAAMSTDPVGRYVDAASMFIALREVAAAVAAWRPVDRAPEPEARDTLPAAEVRNIQVPHKASPAASLASPPVMRERSRAPAVALVLSALALGIAMGPWGRREPVILTAAPAVSGAIATPPVTVLMSQPPPSPLPPPVLSPSGVQGRRPSPQLATYPVASSSIAAPTSSGAALEDGWYTACP